MSTMQAEDVQDLQLLEEQIREKTRILYDKKKSLGDLELTNEKAETAAQESEKNLAVAQEAISFQGNGFFQELLLVINMFKREERTNAYTKQWDEFAENINKCIKKRTGLNCKIKFTRQEYAAILVPLIDYHNVVMSHVLDGAGADADQLKALEKAGGMLKASIDLKNSKVSGALADREAVIMINPLIFTTNIDGLELTDEEIAAVILHEVGHFFTGLEFMDRMVTTNQILAEMARNLNREKEPSKREIIVKKASKELDIDRNQLQDIDLENGKVVTEYMLGVGLKKLRHQNGHSFYDMNTWEMAADQFAVRHGAGAAHRRSHRASPPHRWIPRHTTYTGVRHPAQIGRAHV